MCFFLTFNESKIDWSRFSTHGRDKLYFLVGRSVAGGGESSVRIVFELPEGCGHLGLEGAGQHVMVRIPSQGTVVERPYTPISPPDQRFAEKSMGGVTRDFCHSE